MDEELIRREAQQRAEQARLEGARLSRQLRQQRLQSESDSKWLALEEQKIELPRTSLVGRRAKVVHHFQTWRPLSRVAGKASRHSAKRRNVACGPGCVMPDWTSPGLSRKFLANLLVNVGRILHNHARIAIFRAGRKVLVRFRGNSGVLLVQKSRRTYRGEV